MSDELIWPDAWALHTAAQRGDLACVRQLLAEGANVNAFDDLHKTPLHYAVEREHLQVAELLLQSGADVDMRHEASIGNTPLGAVAGNCSLAMAHLLIAAGANPTIPGWMQLTALHKASRRRRGEGPNVFRLLERAARRRA